MIKRFSCITVALIFFSNLQSSATLEDLKNAYKIKHSELRKLLLSIDGNRNSAEKIVALQRQIKSLESEEGITDLQNTIAALRIESCEIQNAPEGESKKIIDEIKQLSGEVQQITASEREKIEKISQLEAKTDKEKSNAKEAIEILESRMKSKAKDQLKKINLLNSKLYDVPEISDKLDEVTPIAKNLKKKYSSIRSKTDPLDKEISRHIKQIHSNMEPVKNQLKTLKEEIHQLQKLIVEKEPCFAAKESSWPQRWERLFA